MTDAKPHYTTEEQLTRARTFITYLPDKSDPDSFCACMTWLLAEAEAAQRCRDLAAEWESLGSTAGGVDDPANLYGFARELRQALSGP